MFCFVLRKPAAFGGFLTFFFLKEKVAKRSKNVPFYRFVSAGENPKASASPAVTLNAFGGTARRRGRFTDLLRSAGRAIGAFNFNYGDSPFCR